MKNLKIIFLLLTSTLICGKALAFCESNEKPIVPNCFFYKINTSSSEPKECKDMPVTFTLTINSKTFTVADINGTFGGKTYNIKGPVEASIKDPGPFYSFYTVFQSALHIVGTTKIEPKTPPKTSGDKDKTKPKEETFNSLSGKGSIQKVINASIVDVNGSNGFHIYGNGTEINTVYSTLKFIGSSNIATNGNVNCSSINSKANGSISAGDESSLCEIFKGDKAVYFHTADGIFATNSYIPVLENSKVLNHSYEGGTDYPNLTQIFSSTGKSNMTIPVYNFANFGADVEQGATLESTPFGPCITNDGKKCFVGLFKNKDRRISMNITIPLQKESPAGNKPVILTPPPVGLPANVNPDKLGEKEKYTSKSTFNLIALCLNYFAYEQALKGDYAKIQSRGDYGNAIRITDYDSLIDDFLQSTSAQYSLNNCALTLGIGKQLTPLSNESVTSCKDTLKGMGCTSSINTNYNTKNKTFLLDGGALYQGMEELGYSCYCKDICLK